MRNKLLVSRLQFFFIFVVILFSLCNKTWAEPNIVVSITPIASLVSMLTKDQARIITLDTRAGCPHHHHAKPSDKLIIKNAQMVIYIDDNFDESIVSLIKDYKGKKIRISKISGIDFKGINGLNNWHFWLDLDNVKIMQQDIARSLVQHFPEMKKKIEQNLEESLTKIDELAKQKESLNIIPVALLSDSSEHFFKSMNNRQIKVFQVSNISLQNMKKLDQSLNSSNLKCIILSDEQNINSYKKYNKPIIQLNSENWSLPNNSNDLPNLFVNEYHKMIGLLQPCSKFPH